MNVQTHRWIAGGFDYLQAPQYFQMAQEQLIEALLGRDDQLNDAKQAPRDAYESGWSAHLAVSEWPARPNEDRRSSIPDWAARQTPGPR